MLFCFLSNVSLGLICESHLDIAHSWEAMSENDNKGLGNKSEHVSEGANKRVRRVRDVGARKTSILHNFTGNH